MKTFQNIARKLTIYLVAAVVAGGVPLTASAAEDAVSPDSPPAPTYTYDETTGRWNTDSWRYNPETKQYEAVVPPVVQEQDGAVTSPTETALPAPVSTDQTKTEETTTSLDQITQNLESVSATGDASVQSNTLGGDATSGSALAMATVLNQINSSSALAGGQPYTFTSDVYGDVYGDMVLAPELLKAMSTFAAAGPAGAQDVTYNATNRNTLTNNIDLTALSGDATVLDNTVAGNAASGNAAAIANVLNVVNSIIAANKSFVGTINIYGNLNGDILMNREGSPSLISSNASAEFSPGRLIANQNNLTSILNNIDLEARSGAADVSRNTGAGDATSGTAGTNLVVINLAGQNVIAKNSLLVFVNVLGKWVGIIVDAPTGATAAVLGDDVTTNLIAAESTGTGDVSTTVTANTDTQITNNITLKAQTGDATVAGNTTAGNATSGNAAVAANILNMANSAFSVSDWFGVLFINVMGSWLGSFGIDTENGGKATAAAASLKPAGTAPVQTAIGTVAQVFGFTGTTAGQDRNNIQPWTGVVSAQEPASGAGSEPAVLSATDDGENASSAGSGRVASDSRTSPLISVPLAVAILALIGGGIFLGIRLIGSIRERIEYSGIGHLR